MPGSFRSDFSIKDLSGYIQATGVETGFMAINASKGQSKPVKCRNQDDVLTYFGNPSATFPEVFEALAFVQSAPCWIGRAIGTGAYWGGVDVTATNVVPFGGGRGNPETFNFTTATQLTEYTAGSGTGLVKHFSGTATNIPAVNATLKIKVGSTYVNASETGDSISGSDIDSGATHTFIKTTGAYDFTFTGTVGTVAEVTGNVAQPYNLSTNKYVNITIDGTLYENIDLSDGASDPSAVTNVEVVNAINAIIPGTKAHTSGNYVKLNGAIASLASGNISVEDPTLGASALSTVFSSGGGVLSAKGTDPVGAVPKYGETVVLEYSYTSDISSTVSHSFFSASPADDEYKVLIDNISGSQFNLKLYQTVAGNDVYLKEYNYSLLREKDAFGKNLYIMDVFDDDPYLIPVVNSSYAGTIPSLPGTPAVALAGGDSGSAPSASNYVTVWDYAKKVQDYPAKIFMNVNGLNLAYVNNILETYQYYSHQIGVVPLGNDVADAIAWRSATTIDSKYTSLYTNWRKIYDVYNDSYAWISNVGSIGRKYAAMADVYDGLSPAGIDEGPYGGQIADWTTIEMEYGYDDSELADLDAAQINPIILDEIYGVMIYGDKTLQVSLSDTSFIHSKRIIDTIIETAVKQVLRKQEFKLNDQNHQLSAKSKIETFMEPILAKQLIRDYRVQCDDINNSDAVKTQRLFIVDIILKVSVNSQKCRVRLTQTSQNAVLSQITPA
jgi:hypothetical protein